MTIFRNTLRKREWVLSNFRDDYKADLKMRAIDGLLHISIAFVIVVIIMRLPWPFMLTQWLPDIYLLFIWPYSMMTKKYVSSDNFFLVGHRSLHRLVTCVSLLLLMVCYDFSEHWKTLPITLLLFSNWLAHIGIDSFTHEGVR